MRRRQRVQHLPAPRRYTFTRKGYEGLRKDVEKCLRNAHLLKVGACVVVGGGGAPPAGAAALQAELRAVCRLAPAPARDLPAHPQLPPAPTTHPCVLRPCWTRRG